MTSEAQPAPTPAPQPEEEEEEEDHGFYAQYHPRRRKQIPSFGGGSLTDSIGGGGLFGGYQQ